MNTALVKKWAGRLALLALLVLTFAARAHKSADVFHGGGIYFTDGDCYSRMERARMVTEGRWTIRHHDFENWPEGTTPHTTAPLDWLIVGTKFACDAALWVVDRDGAARAQSLDLAGALVSPLLGVFTALWLWCWAGWLRLPFRGLMVLFFALSPILVHATELGRPDHQSLLVALLAVAVCAELALADTGLPARLARRWSLVAGFAWGLAMWVSLFEPVIFFLGAIARHLAFHRMALIARAARGRWIALAVTLLVALAVDGWRFTMPDALLRKHFGAWSGTISELAHLDLASKRVWFWLGALWLTALPLLGFAGRRDGRAWGALLLVALMLGLSVWELRWGFYLALAVAVSVPWQLGCLSKRWHGWALGVAALVPLVFAWGGILHPGEEEAEMRRWRRSTQEAWREVAVHLRSAERQPFLAPWWASPQVSYWSGQPGIAGTSHQSLAGTLDSARFYLAQEPAGAAAILRARGVRWVIVDDLSHTSERLGELLIVSNSAKVLAMPVPQESLGEVLAKSWRSAPPFLRYVTPEERGQVRKIQVTEGGKTEDTSMTFYAPQYHQLYEVKADKL